MAPLFGVGTELPLLSKPFYKGISSDSHVDLGNSSSIGRTPNGGGKQVHTVTTTPPRIPALQAEKTSRWWPVHFLPAWTVRPLTKSLIQSPERDAPPTATLSTRPLARSPTHHLAISFLHSLSRPCRWCLAGQPRAYAPFLFRMSHFWVWVEGDYVWRLGWAPSVGTSAEREMKSGGCSLRQGLEDRGGDAIVL